MRIGLVIQSGIILGGAHNYETNFRALLQRACDESSHELVTFISSSISPKTKSRDFVTYKSSPLRFAFAHLRSHALIRTILSVIGLGKSDLEKKAVKQEIDVLIFSSPHHLSPGIHSLPIATTAWDFGHLDLPHYPETGLEGLWHWREELFASTVPRSILIFCDTYKTRDVLVKRYNAYPDRVIVIGLLPSVPAKVEPEIMDKPHFIYPSMFWPHKNHVTLVDAFNCFIKEHGELAYLVFTGEGSVRPAIEKLVEEYEISHLVKFEGLVPRSRLMNLVSGSRGLLMPSLLGPSNIPPLEAALLGIPAVVSDEHYMSSMLETIELVGAKDVKGWSQALQKLYSNAVVVSRLLPQDEYNTVTTALSKIEIEAIDPRVM